MIARKTWREVRLMTIGYLLILEVLLIPAILLYPELRPHAEALENLMPMEFLRDIARSLSDPDTDFAYRQYMSVQIFFKGINIVGISGAVLLCTAIVARERENRTLEFLLARPVGRTRILLTKFGVVAAALVVPIFLTSWSALPLSGAIDQELPFWPMTIACVHASAVVLMFAALTTLCSVLLQTQAHVAFVVGAFVIIQAALYFIQVLNVASLFRLTDPFIYGPIFESKYDLWATFKIFTVWPLLATVALIGLAVLAFRRVEP